MHASQLSASRGFPVPRMTKRYGQRMGTDALARDAAGSVGALRAGRKKKTGWAAIESTSTILTV